MAHTIGSFAFLIGILVAVIVGIIMAGMPAVLSGASGVILLVLIILGLIVGLLNVKEEHKSDFLVAIIAVAMVGSLTVQQSGELIPQIAPIVSIVFQNIVAFSAPAALIVGLRQIWSLGYTKTLKK